MYFKQSLDKHLQGYADSVWLLPSLEAPPKLKFKASMGLCHVNMHTFPVLD